MDGGQEDAAGHGRQYGEEAAEKWTMEALLDIVGRSAAELPVVVFLIDLGQSGLDKGAAGTEEGDNPHPDDGSRTAEADGSGHTHDVARTHTSRQGHGKSLERGDAGFFLRLRVFVTTRLRVLLSRCLDVSMSRCLDTNQQSEHLAEAAYLYKACPQ